MHICRASSPPGQDGRHFAEDIFKRNFVIKNVTISIQISLKFVLRDSNDNKSALVQVMAWCRTGDKPLPDQVSWRIYAPLDGYELISGRWCARHTQEWNPKANCGSRTYFPPMTKHILPSQTHGCEGGHCSDVKMGAMASQITGLTIVYSSVYSGADHKNIKVPHQSLAFVMGIHRWSVNSSHKWPATRKMFPLDDVIM